MLSTMSARERLLAALHGQAHDRVPFSPFLAYVWEHWPEDVRAEGQLAVLRRIGADPLWRGAPCPVRALRPQIEIERSETAGKVIELLKTPVGCLRQGWSRSATANTGFLVDHPVKTLDDLRTLRWIEEHTRFEVDLDPVHRHVAGDGAEGLSLGMLVPRGKSAFQILVEHHIGTQELALLLADHPEEVEATWEVMVARNQEAAALAIGTGAYDHWLTWEDSSTQNYSPRQYQRYVATEIAEWCAMLRVQGMHYVQHACGHIRHLVGMMCDGGVLAVESLSPPPTGNVTVGAVRQQLGAALGIVGGLEPTRLLRLDDAAFAADVERTIAEGRGGPFVLGNSDSCPPGVTVERFARAAAIARASGPVGATRPAAVTSVA